MLRPVLLLSLISLIGYGAYSQDTVKVELRPNYELAIPDYMYESVSLTLSNLDIEEDNYAVYMEYVNHKAFYDNIPEDYVYIRCKHNEKIISRKAKKNKKVFIIETSN